VSNDNPFSEAQFRTFKYRPECPDRFGSIQDARATCHALFGWYNDAHHHSGLRYLTPADVHYGRAAATLAVRHRTRLAAYEAHPERFVQGAAAPRDFADSGVDQPACQQTDAPGCPTNDDRDPDDPQHGVILGPDVLVEDQSFVLVNRVKSLH
jgi:putative transposase